MGLVNWATFIFGLFGFALGVGFMIWLAIKDIRQKKELERIKRML